MTCFSVSMYNFLNVRHWSSRTKMLNAAREAHAASNIHAMGSNLNLAAANVVLDTDITKITYNVGKRKNTKTCRETKKYNFLRHRCRESEITESRKTESRKSKILAPKKKKCENISKINVNMYVFVIVVPRHCM